MSDTGVCPPPPPPPHIPLPPAGEKSSRDECVVCAVLATQLDNFLGGEPIQHRHVQGYEAAEFMVLFPRGVSYKVGGMSWVMQRGGGGGRGRGSGGARLAMYAVSLSTMSSVEAVFWSNKCFNILYQRK